MTLPLPTPAPGWTIQVDARLKYTGTLLYDFGGGVVYEARMTPAKTSLVLALIACREIDERDGVTTKIGYCSLEELGELVGEMPGDSSPITGSTVGDYKRAIARIIRNALRALSFKVGRTLRATPPILQRGHGQGYCLPDEGIALIGVSLDALVDAVREFRARRSNGFPPW